eukprot:COSAG06_NODE_3202_length_5693_cov_3.420272_1_plen_69_part_00
MGFIQRHCLPTYRGFDTFLGYYTACTSDYWYHGAPGEGGGCLEALVAVWLKAISIGSSSHFTNAGRNG